MQQLNSFYLSYNLQQGFPDAADKRLASSLAQAAAAAAERRARDDVGCGCGAKASTDLTEADVIALEGKQPVQGSDVGNAGLLTTLSRQPEPVASTEPQGSSVWAQASLCAAGQVSMSAGTLPNRPKVQSDMAQAETIEKAPRLAMVSGRHTRAQHMLEGLVDLTGDSGEEDVEVLE